MDHGYFDDLTRSVASGVENRRQLMRTLTGVLLGGAFSGVAARFGLANVTEAKAKHHKARRKPKRTSQADRKPQGPLQTEGKRKGKKRKKKPVLRTPCYLTDCEERGGHCCDDGKCAAAGACCPDKYRCDDGTCVDPLDECCPEQKDCGGGVCVAADACCPGQKTCSGYTECFAADDCCPNAVPPLCNPCDKVVCQNGGLVCQPRPDREPCGDACCEQDEVCLEDPGGPPWIWRCCPDELNVNGRCCDGNKTVCGPPPGGQPWERYCCSEGTECCGGDSCCPLDTHVCCNGHCLPKNLGPWFSCGNHCCRSEYDQCCGDGCCAKEAVCCGDPPRCCPRSYHCCGQFCCRD